LKKDWHDAIGSTSGCALNNQAVGL